MRPGKKLIKRKPKGGASPQDFYFNAGTQQAIVDYKAELLPAKRNELYVDLILPAFSKLVENLYGVIGKFDASKGTKAFSYFNVVAKNWLIIRSKQSVRNIHVFTSLDDLESLSQHDLETIENHSIALSPEDVMINTVNSNWLKEVLGIITSLATTDNEIECLKGINMLFENIHELDFLNKRAIMLYLREITSLNPKNLSVVLSTMKRHYKVAKEEYEQRTT